MSLDRTKLLVAGLALALAGCASSAGPTPAASGAAPSAPVPSVIPTLASASASATVSPQLVQCFESRCQIAPGAYLTGLGGFFPGLAIQIPEGWGVIENSSGELSLGQEDHPGSNLFLWKDVRAVVSNHRSAKEGTLVKEVAGTPEAIVEWLTTNPDFTVIEQPKPATIAGMSGTVLAVGVSETADFGEPDCPSNPRCADFFTDPAHWGSGVFGIGGGDGTLRLFMTTLHYPDGDHLFAVGWQGDTAADMRAFAVPTQPILDSIRVPDRYVSN